MTLRGTILTTIESTSFFIESCSECGIVYGIPQGLQAALTQNRNWFYCPNGHSQRYMHKTDAERLAETEATLGRVRAYAKSVEDQREAAERSNTALRGVVTKKKKELGRVKNGVCPCCKRSFQNLRRHIEGQHPDYEPSK